MDDVATGAVTAVVHDTRDEFDRWFEIIKEQYDALEPDEDWEEFSQYFSTAALAEQYTAEQVQAFQEYLAPLQSPMDVIGQLADEGEWAAALSAYEEVYELAAGADGGGEAPGDEAAGDVAEEVVEAAADEDEDAFYAYLVREWRGVWDGTENSWADYAGKVVQGASDEGFPVSADGWRKYVEGAGSKADAMAEYGLEEDENGFYTYLVTDWSGKWDGTESSWADYAGKVVQAASRERFPANALGWRAYVEGSGDKVAALREYGLSISEAPAAGASAASAASEAVEADTDDEGLGEAFLQLFGPETIAAAESSAEKAAEHLVGAGQVPSDLGDQLPAAFRDVIAEIPEAAAMSEAEIRELFAELAEEAQVQA